MFFLLKEKFFESLKQLIVTIEEKQNDGITKAAQVIADAMADGKCVHIYDTGHMLNSELINRAGGLTAFRALNISLHVENNVRKRPRDPGADRSMAGLMHFSLKQSNVHPGDVLIIGSVSGKSVSPVDLAIAAKEFGAYVIAMTSVEYSSQLKSEHPTGKRLFEAADLVLDNCAPPLDAMVEVPGQEIGICPASGISAATIMWAVKAQVVELLIEKNKKPSILKSINNPGSDVFNEDAYRSYEETGC